MLFHWINTFNPEGFPHLSRFEHNNQVHILNLEMDPLSVTEPEPDTLPEPINVQIPVHKPLGRPRFDRPKPDIKTLVSRLINFLSSLL